jgi:hypothetical protein
MGKEPKKTGNREDRKSGRILDYPYLTIGLSVFPTPNFL